MNNFIKKIFGIDKIEAAIEEAVLARIEAERATSRSSSRRSNRGGTDRKGKSQGTRN